MRLIDADKLIKELEYAVSSDKLTSYDDMFDIIERFSTADVQLVQYGRWTEQRDMEEFDFKIYKCSVCEKINEIDTALDDISNYKYCPNCGSYNGESK